VSSIRLFILGSLAERGPMHGHGLLLLAEEEHIDLWTDFAASAVYGAIKRLAAEGLIGDERVEKHGNYPERQVFRISDSGRKTLDDLREQALTEIVIKHDPLDLALARLDPDRLDDLPAVIQDRLSRLREGYEADSARLEEFTQYLTVAERWSMLHGLSRRRGEIGWHEELLEALPTIISDERSRKDTPND
jgi:DNA-binding PadR family transcriptional regulator